ncbi:CPBP family intramembrane glutamic endopeptidase [Marinicella marina]|uniref:CPBP family intramembrane glutamic endopeptidase n=2 Tax=Marinicella marina TaxID=2996016 RepID=UPI002B2193D5|nr:type II CAAX endopeptidase family protein [Marinicella marina]
MKISKDSLLTLSIFAIFTVLLYFVGFWLIYRTGKATPLMLSVGLAALLTVLIRSRNLNSLGWAWGHSKHQWMSYFIPLFLATCAYLTIWFLGFAGWYNLESVNEMKSDYNLLEWSDYQVIIFHFLITATMTFIMTLPSVLGEEVAWRGLLVPELSKFMGFTGVSLISGLLWSFWHFPLIVLGLYGNDGTPLVFQLIVFTVFITSISVVMAYYRLKSGGIWTAVIFHMSNNVFIQKFYAPLTVETTNSNWFTDEFGLIPASVAVVFALIYWRKGRVEFDCLNKSK